MRRRYLAVILASFALVAALGSSLGLVAAGTRQPLVAGFNLVGGPLSADVAPNQFVACLPQGSWVAIYIWDAQNQVWRHHFNTASVPAYVNETNLGGIAIIPRLSGVVLMMSQAVSNPRLKDSPAEACS
jgi:hypothetical protein